LKSGVKLVIVMKAHKLLGRGCEGFLRNVQKPRPLNHPFRTFQ